MRKCLLVLILLTSALYARVDFWRCFEYEVGVDVLYWMPMQCDYTFASFPVDFNIRTFAVEQDYFWGARPFIRANKGCNWAQLSYLGYRNTDTGMVESGNVISVAGINASLFSRALGKLHQRYQNVDLRVGRDLYTNFYLFGNVRYVDLKFIQTTRAAGPAGTAIIVESATYQGGALGVGMGGHICFWDYFKAFGEINPQGVIGEQKNPKNRAIVLGANTFIINQKATCVTPELDAKLGIEMNFCWGGKEFMGQVGYEVHYFWDALRYKDRVPGVVPAPTDVVGHDVGFAGPFARFRVTF